MKLNVWTVLIRTIAILGILYGVFLLVAIGIVGLFYNVAFGYELTVIFRHLKSIVFVLVGLSLIVSGLNILRRKSWSKIIFITTLILDLVFEKYFIVTQQGDFNVSSVFDIGLIISIMILVSIAWLFTTGRSRAYFSV